MADRLTDEQKATRWKIQNPNARKPPIEVVLASDYDALLAEVRALRAERENPNGDAGMYRRVLRDLHAIVHGGGEPTTHGLDYTTIIGARMRKLEAEVAALREAARTAYLDERERFAAFMDGLCDAMQKDGYPEQADLLRREVAGFRAALAGVRAGEKA